MGTRSLTRIIPRQEGLAYDVAHKRAELALVNIISNMMVILRIWQ